jgi:hypothetical protein
LDEFQERVVERPVSIAAGETFNEMVGAGISGSGGGGGGGSSTGGGGGGATFLAHPIPDIIKAAMRNAKETSVVVDLRMAASPSLVLRFNPNFNYSITTESGAVYHVPESVKTKQAKKTGFHGVSGYIRPMQGRCCPRFGLSCAFRPIRSAA